MSDIPKWPRSRSPVRQVDPPAWNVAVEMDGSIWWFRQDLWYMASDSSSYVLLSWWFYFSGKTVNFRKDLDVMSIVSWWLRQFHGNFYKEKWLAIFLPPLDRWFEYGQWLRRPKGYETERNVGKMDNADQQPQMEHFCSKVSCSKIEKNRSNHWFQLEFLPAKCAPAKMAGATDHHHLPVRPRHLLGFTESPRCCAKQSTHKPLNSVTIDQGRRVSSVVFFGYLIVPTTMIWISSTVKFMH